MFVCVCNAITDESIDNAIMNGATNARQVMDMIGCRAQCGCCMRSVQGIMREKMDQTEKQAA